MGVPRKSMAGLALTALLLLRVPTTAIAMAAASATTRLLIAAPQEDQRLLPADQPDVKEQVFVFKIPPLLLLTRLQKSAIPADKIPAAPVMPATRPVRALQQPSAYQFLPTPVTLTFARLLVVMVVRVQPLGLILLVGGRDIVVLALDLTQTPNTSFARVAQFKNIFFQTHIKIKEILSWLKAMPRFHKFYAFKKGFPLPKG